MLLILCRRKTTTDTITVHVIQVYKAFFVPLKGIYSVFFLFSYKYTLFGDFGPYWHIDMKVSGDWLAAHLWLEAPVLLHPKGALLERVLVTVEAVWAQWTHCHVKPDLSFVTWCTVLLEGAIRRWVKEWIWSGTILGYVVPRHGKKCVKKVSSTPLDPAVLSVDTRQDGSVI